MPTPIKPIVLIGPPGAGKGTQAGFLSSQLHIPHISTGDLLRSHIASADDLGKQVKEIVDKGGLVSDSLLFPIVEERIVAEDCKYGYILDGFPRTLVQAKWLNARVDVLAVFIALSEETILTRLALRGRVDDGADTVKERLKEFETLTRPVVLYYKELKQLKILNGERPAHEVFKQFAKAAL